jgi:phage anti-repressor protein
MKKKSNDMSPDMFNDAMSSTPIPVFINANDAAQNEPLEQIPSVTDMPEVSFDANQITNELIKIDFDKQTVSARALYQFLESTDRFSKWWQRMISYGLTENIDYTGVNFFTSVNNGAKQDIGDYLLTIDAAKHIAMVQRNEKGFQARTYFINIEKLYLKGIFSKNQNPVTSVTPFEKIRNLLVEIEGEMIQRKDYDSLLEKTIALEKKVVEQANLYNLKDEYIEHTISKKIDMAVKASFREAEQIRLGAELVNTLPCATNQSTVVVLNQLEKNLQKTTLEEDLILKCYRPAERKTENALFLTATELTLHLETFSKKVSVRNVGMALKKFGFERVHRGIDGHRAKGYYVIQLHGSI